MADPWTCDTRVALYLVIKIMYSDSPLKQVLYIEPLKLGI